MKNVLVAVSCLVLMASVNASTLVWNGAQWPYGSLEESYNIDGVGLDIAFSGNTDALIGSHPNTGGNALPTDLFTGWDVQGLWWGNETVVDPGAPIVITMTFDTPVTDLNFSFYDLDDGEQLDMDAYLGAAPEDPFEVIYGGINYDNVTGLFDGAGVIGNPGDAVNTATITFMDPVDTLVFSYSAPQANRGMLLSNVTFVPEPATLSLLALGAFVLRRRK